MNPSTEPLHPFTPTEFRRLWAAREAIRVGYYSDAIDNVSMTDCVLDVEYLRAPRIGPNPNSYVKLHNCGRYHDLRMGC